MREHILAIDPGMKPGVAQFEVEDGRAKLVRVSHKIDQLCYAAPPWDLLVTELQWHYANSKSRVQDILKLAFRAGYTLGNIPAVRRMALPPRVWRGTNATKEQVQARIAAQLTPSERELFRNIPKARHGDVLDAIGIGRAALMLARTPEGSAYDFDLTT